MGRESKRTDAALEKLVEMGAVDLTRQALAGNFSHAYGRDTEVESIFASLLAQRSALLLGPTDSGKTTILHEAISRIAHEQCPPELRGKRFVSISTGTMLVGTKYLGEWQTRLGELVDAVRESDDIIVVIEDIWALRDAGRASDKSDGFATFLRPFLERQQLILLGETTQENYTTGGAGARALADDTSLMKLFTIIQVDEPSRDATKAILAAVARDEQKTHRVRIEVAAVERSLELPRRFLAYQAFPGKATRLLRHAVAELVKGAPSVVGTQPSASQTLPKDGRSASERIVTAEIVNAAFSTMTGLPRKIISDSESLSQDEIHAYFSERIIGQREAVDAVVDVITLVKAELNDPGRPLGVLFFVGPTGVGKTELAKTLAEYLFGSKDKLVRLDMSEYKSPASLTDLLQQLTEKQRRQVFSVLLLDEIEKANSYAFDLFLQVFDDARLTDAAGHSVDLRNTIIILTSNVGTQMSERGNLGFRDSADPAAQRREQIVSAVHEYFRPEFINRLDKIVVFQPLGLGEMRTIARRELGRALLREGVLRRNILLDFREEVLDELLTLGFSPTFGARPLQRAIREHVLLPLARRIAAQPAAGEELLELVMRDGSIAAESIPVNPHAEAERPEQEELRERLTITDAISGRARTLDIKQLERAIASVQERITAQMSSEDYERIESEALRLLEETGHPTFWDNPEQARRSLARVYHLERITDRFADLQARAERLAETAQLIHRHNDAAGLPRLASNFEALDRDIILAALEMAAGQNHTPATDELFLRIIPIANSGARGRPPASKLRGTGVAEQTSEVNDWPERLCDMYLAWATRKGHEVTLVGEPEGETRTLLLRGPNLLNMLRGEQGTHKLQTESQDERKRERGQLQVRLAYVELLAAPPLAELPFGREALHTLSPSERANAALTRSVRQGRTAAHPTGSYASPTLAEASDAQTGTRVRVVCANAEDVALRLLAALLARPEPAASEQQAIARVYHLAKTHYVRDPRSQHREGRARDVLAGAIDPFILAYLTGNGEQEPAGDPQPALVHAHIRAPHDAAAQDDE